MDAAGIAKLITLCCLVVVFIAAILITPRIWHSNEGAKPSEGEKKSGRAGSPR